MRLGDIAPLPEDLFLEYKYKNVFFKECALVGVSFHIEKDDEIWDELEVGTKLALVRDKYNKYDQNAVAVALADDYDGDPDDFDFDLILGYIPKNDNSELAAMIDAGYADKFSAEITTYKRSGSYNDRIRLTIYIESSEPELIRPGLLRAESVSIEELRAIVDELDKRGTAYVRWGNHGFPLTELQSPIVGEKVVLVHRNIYSDILYLMRVLATDGDCERYVDDPDSIHCCDDCSPFILTNVMGPVRINKSDYSFLVGIDMKRFSVKDYLSPEISNGFKEIFDNHIKNAYWKE